MEKISHSQLLETLSYNKDTGVFSWKKDAGSRGIKAGTSVGYVDQSTGRVDVRIKNKHYKAHRLAWFYVYGEWPAMEIDHIDRSPSNNAIANLRLATREENSHNQVAPRADNALGIRGVSFVTSKNKFKAQIGFGGKNFHIGYFKTTAEATEAYLFAKALVHKPVYQVGR